MQNEITSQLSKHSSLKWRHNLVHHAEHSVHPVDKIHRVIKVCPGQTSNVGQFGASFAA